MRPKATLAAAGVGLFLSLPTTAHAECADADLPVTAETVPQATEALFCLHNEERALAGLPLPLEHAPGEGGLRPLLGHGGRSYFDHNSPEGTTPSDRMQAAGYGSDDFTWEGAENIAWANGESATPRNTTERWMASQAHHDNILNPDVRDIGFGIVAGAPTPSPNDKPPQAVTYTANLGMREVSDDDTVLASPTGPTLGPPPAAPETTDPPVATTDDRRLKSCLRKANAAKRKKTRKRKRASCKRRFATKR